MIVDRIQLPAAAPGVQHCLHVWRFGTAGAHPRAYVQGGLHADEAPGMMAAHELCRVLQREEEAGRVLGEVVVVPVANPPGGFQRMMGGHVGRFDLADGRNWNRHYPALWHGATARLQGKLGGDAAVNTGLIRAALQATLEAEHPAAPADQLRHSLLRLALSADMVLDLHCDGEALMHLYTLPQLAGHFDPLARLLGARTVLLAEESGDDPFDESLSRPWVEIARAFPDMPVPLGCAAVTVELRGRADTDPATLAGDAEALAGALAHAGVLAEPPALPAALCRPTPFAGSEPLVVPQAGVLAFHASVGATVRRGDLVAEVIDPATGHRAPVSSPTDGLLFARTGARIVWAGQRVGKVAGSTATRTGKLLSA